MALKRRISVRNRNPVTGRMSVPLLGLLLLVVPAVQAQGETEKIYKENCAVCHGENGNGDTPSGKLMGTPDFRSPIVQKQTDAALTESITKGKNNKMPAWGPILKNTEIKDLVAYIRRLAAKK